ncbi:MAG: type II toxin-antitoxin system RelE/ParE family toxin [Planctomycetota bacterium]
MKLSIREYLDPNGRNPFREWLLTMNPQARARIQARILRFEQGNLGDHKFVGHGVWEAKADFGPGFRIYFGKAGRTLIVLLAGGSKGTQSRDIRKAWDRWRDYEEAKKHDKTH